MLEKAMFLNLFIQMEQSGFMLDLKIQDNSTKDS
tara:strand:- start:323 stop:424 length:102 start_codon:yes stop_codon:yes gene_type:complete